MGRTWLSAFLMVLLTCVPLGVALAEAPREVMGPVSIGPRPVADMVESTPPSLGLWENRGQSSRDDILFYSTGNPMVGLGLSTVVTALFDEDGRGYSYEMEFIGSDPSSIEGMDKVEGYMNYMKGNAPSGWITGVGGFEGVHYDDLYPGIDMVYRSGAEGVKYDLLAYPWSDPKAIVVEYRFTDGLSIDEEGNLRIMTPLGTLVEGSPRAYQSGGEVAVSFKLIGSSTVSFEIGDYDRSELLVIDPLLKRSTFLGGRDDEMTESPPFIYQGDIIVAGTTYSMNFPTTSGVVDTSCSEYDAFITRMSSDMTTLVWSTYLGGTESDYGYDLDVDASGNVFITGETYAKDFPVTAGAYDTEPDIRTVIDEWGWEYTIWDSYATKMASDGKSLIYSTFVGGKGNDTAQSIVADRSGNAYVAGYTDSTDLPTLDPYQDTLYGTQDGFVMVLDTKGSGLVWSTYLGGYDSWGEQIFDIELDSNGKAVVLGHTSASDFPVTKGAYNTVYVYDMPFVTKFSSSGSSLEFSTFIFQETYGQDMCLYNDEVYVTGYTYYSSFPATKDAFSNTMGGWSDAFVTVLSSDGSRLVYATLLGGSEYEVGYHIIVDVHGAMMVSGYTSSTDFPLTQDTYQNYLNGYGDAFLAWFEQDRQDLYFSTYFGGGNEEYGYGSIMTASYEVLLYGTTSSSDLPTTKGTYSPNFNGGYQDVFLAHFKTNSFRPGRPMSLSLQAGNAVIDLSWSPPLQDGNETVTTYIIYGSVNNESFDVLETVNADTLTYSDLNVQNGKRYYYYVSATNIIGEGPFSNIVSGVPITVPSVPLDLKLRKGNGFVELSWSYPADDGGDPFIDFNIYSGTDQAALILSVEAFDGTLYNFTGLENGVIYYFRVHAVTKAGEGPGTVVLSTYPSTIPTAPRNLTSVRGDRFIHLYWEAPSYFGGEDEVTYNVFSSTNNVTFVRIGTRLTALEYNVTALENGLALYFRVTALNIRGEGPVSNVVEDRAIGAPSEPREVQVAAGDGNALVGWLPPNSMGGDLSVTYNVYVGTGVYQMELKATGLTATELLVGGLDNGVLYYFAVSAENALYEGPLSLFVTGMPLRPPSVPLDLAVEVGDGKLTLTWSPPADLGGDVSVMYEVHFGTSLESMLLTATTEVPTYHEPGLKNGKTYYAMVRAKNLAGEGPFTEPVSGTPMGRPSAPLSLIIARGDRSLNVSWTRPLDLGGAEHVLYTIYLSNASRSLFPYATSIGSTAYTISDLTNGVKYQVSVSAANIAGESELSNSVESTPMTVPGAPQFDLKPMDSMMNLTWTLPLNNGGSEITQVRIYRAVEGKEPIFHRMVPASRGAFTDMDLDNGVTYRYALSCMNEVGEGPRSEIREAAPKADSEPTSVSGLLIAGLAVAFLVIALVVVIVLLLVRRGKTVPALPGPMPPQVPGMVYGQTGAQLPPGYVQGLPASPQYGLPPAPPQAPPPVQQVPVPEQIAQQQAGYQPTPQDMYLPPTAEVAQGPTVQAGPLDVQAPPVEQPLISEQPLEPPVQNPPPQQQF